MIIMNEDIAFECADCTDNIRRNEGIVFECEECYCPFTLC